jgi:hypothetical protein
MEYLDYGGVYQLPTSVVCKTTLYQTVYISGRKTNSDDIVGFFFSERKTRKRRFRTNRVKDFISFAAVKFNKVKTYCTTLKRRKNEGKEIQN